MEAKQNKHRAKKRGRQGYIHKSNALNLTVYDLHGNALPQDFVDEVLETVNERSLARGLMLTYTQT